MQSGEEREFTAGRVALAAGALLSTRIFLTTMMRERVRMALFLDKRGRELRGCYPEPGRATTKIFKGRDGQARAKKNRAPKTRSFSFPTCRAFSSD